MFFIFIAADYRITGIITTFLLIKHNLSKNFDIKKKQRQDKLKRFVNRRFFFLFFILAQFFCHNLTRFHALYEC